MELRELLSELGERGVRLAADGENLVVRAPDGRLTPELRERLRRWKPELLAELRRPTTAPALVPITRDREIPLSFAQQRLWFLDQLGAGAAYNIPWALRLSGRLDIGALEASLNEIVRRHEALRTTFPANEGRAAQAIAPARASTLPVTDLSGAAEGDGEPETGRLALEEAQRPFDLARGPLLRARLVRLQETEHVLLLNVHHIVFDGWSAGVFNTELGALYGAFLSGKPSPLPEPPVQYADFAVWQRQWLQGERLERQLSYWKERLSGEPPRLELPTDRPRREVESVQGAAHAFVFPASLTEGLRDLGQRAGATQFMVLLAGFKALLQCYCDVDDILVGVPIANRTRSELEGLIGLFANSCVMRTDLSGDPSFWTLVERVKDTARGAGEHDTLPVERLVDELKPDRDAGRNPFFQVAFALQNVPPGRLELPGLTLSFETDVKVTRFDLEVHLYEYRESTSAVLIYKTDLFDAATMERLGRHFVTLLEGAVACPEARLSDLALLSEGERRQVLVDWNATARAYPRDSSIGEEFERQADRAPDAEAVVCGGERLSYGELNRRGNQLARHLRGLGVGPEVRVGICVERSAELVVGLLGILKAGGAYVPLDPGYPAERLGFMLEDSGVGVLLTQERLVSELPGPGAQVEALCLDRDWGEVSKESGENLASGVGGEHLAYVTYTSGSTGTPKGVEVRHRGVLRLVLGAEYADLGPEETLLQLAPVSFDASTLEIWGALLAGGRCVLYPPGLATAQELGEVIEREGVSTLWLTASLFNAMVDESPSALGGLKQLLIGGEALSVAHVRRGLAALPGTRIINGYGPTEGTTFTCCHPIPPEVEEGESIPIGRPISNTRVYVLDGGLSPVPVGVAGELFIGGDGLARGYQNQPGLTAEQFVPDPFGEEPGGRLYRTGDLVRWRGDGAMEFLGRKDHQVKLRGFRVELGEIESALGRHPGVKDVAVALREDHPGERRLVAYVTAGAGGEVEVDELRRHVQATLPEYMVPSTFVSLESLPLSPNGKVDRQALPAPTRGAAGKAYEGPRTPAEETLVRIWSEVLRAERVGVHDNFFELGGDSIISIQIVARASQAGLRVTPMQVFRHPTVAALARVAGTTAQGEAEQGLVTGGVPLTPVQRWFFERDLDEPHHFNHAVLLEVGSGLDAGVLEAAVGALEEHHDALRLRFARSGLGWKQEIAGPGESSFVRVDLTQARPEEEGRAIETAASELQRGLDLRRGPIWRVALLELGGARPSRLLIVIHHLAVDGVSWRVLLEDLRAACEQLTRGERPRLPPKTTSFRAWSERLVGYAEGEGPSGELEYWRGVVADPVPLPVGHPGGEDRNTVATRRTVSTALGEDDTRALLQDVPAAQRTEIGAVLLTALLDAFRGWTGRDELLIDLEGHGREDLFEGVDLSRTVGWFTTIYPVRLKREAGGAIEALRGVKEQLRRIPQRGIGYGVLRHLRGEEIGSGAQVSFNYLGQLDPPLGDTSLLGPAAESTGRGLSERGRRPYLIEVDGLVSGGRLLLEWAYSEAVHERGTVEALARRFEDSLSGLIALCRSGERAYTPSDFPLAGLDAASLARVLGASPEVER